MENYEVVIIGGGISGLYCAKKLRDNGVDGIVVLEKSDRWGGRLNTDMIEINNRTIKDEKGAMRFTYKDPDNEPKSNMPLLSRLIKDLQMEFEVEPFYMRPQPAKNNSMAEVRNFNSHYFSGRHFTTWYAKQNPLIWKELFNSETPEDVSLSASQIIEDVYQKLLDQNVDKVKRYFSSLGREEVAEIVLMQNDVQLLQEHQDGQYWAFFRNEFGWPVGSQIIKIKDLTLSTLLEAMGYSRSCYQMMVKTLFNGEDTLSRAKVGSVLQYHLVSNMLHNDLHHFKNGWSSLVKKIERDLEEGANKVGLLKNCEVETINDDGEGFMIKFSSGKMKVRGEHVVMAIPPKAVEELFARSRNEINFLAGYDSVMSLCKSVVAADCLKVILYFEHDWWNKYDGTILFGPNCTDLSCGSIWPYYDNCRTNCKGCDDCIDGINPSALVIYCASNKAASWKDYQRLGQRFESPLQKKYSNLTAASEPLVREALEQFKKVFNVEDIPNPILTSYRSWDVGSDYGYAYHYWGLGVDDQTLEVSQPVEGKNLYFCSESWSGYQGYVEGSLMSTEKVVDRIVRNCKENCS